MAKYFRLEWKLAVDRSHLMAARRTVLLPVIIDDARNDDEQLPGKFREVHWTHLPGGETPLHYINVPEAWSERWGYTANAAVRAGARGSRRHRRRLLLTKDDPALRAFQQAKGITN